MPHDLDALFRAYRGELNRLAVRGVGNRDDAADIVQDAFLRFASLRGDGATGIDNPRWFLWRIVGNLVRDLRRRDRRRGVHVAIEDAGHPLIDAGCDPDRQLAARQQLALLRAALDELPENCRAALLLNRLDGLSHGEIAARLGVSASMVSKYIMRAMRHCMRRLRQRE